MDFRLKGGEYELRVSDNGVGLPGEFDLNEVKTLGLHLVNMWAMHQLEGSIRVGELSSSENGERKGTVFSVRFPKRN